MIGWRTVVALVRHSTEESALQTVRRKTRPAGPVEDSGPGEYTDWPVDRHINVMLLDEMRMGNWLQRAIAAAKAGKTPPPAPKPTWRPGIAVTDTGSGFTKNGDTTQVGSAPIPMADFEAWWNASQEERDNWKGAA